MEKQQGCPQSAQTCGVVHTSLLAGILWALLGPPRAWGPTLLCPFLRSPSCCCGPIRNLEEAGWEQAESLGVGKSWLARGLGLLQHGPAVCTLRAKGICLLLSCLPQACQLLAVRGLGASSQPPAGSPSSWLAAFSLSTWDPVALWPRDLLVGGRGLGPLCLGLAPGCDIPDLFSSKRDGLAAGRSDLCWGC